MGAVAIEEAVLEKLQHTSVDVLTSRDPSAECLLSTIRRHRNRNRFGLPSWHDPHQRGLWQQIESRG